MSHKRVSFKKSLRATIAHLIVTLAICLTVSPLPLPAQSQDKPSIKKSADDDDIIRVNSNLVNVDVTVRDKKGKVVRDLKAEDFTITENGVEQSIEFFDATLVGGPPAQAASTAPGEPTLPVPPLVLPRNVVSFVLDGQTTESLNLKPVRDGITKYIRDRITNNDSVALFAISGGLQLLQPFTRDKEKILAAIEQASSTSVGAKSSELRDLNTTIANLREQVSGASTTTIDTAAGGTAGAEAMISRRVLEQYIQLRSALSVQQTRPILAALAAICEGLRPMTGKKTLVMFSQGFVAPQVLDWQVQSTIDIANRANVSIYIIDSTGLKGGTPQSGALVPSSALSGISAAVDQESRIRAGSGESVFDISRQEGMNRQQDLLYRISEDTGGHFIKNTNDIGDGLKRIDDEIRARYTLAYRSTDQNFDGRFRKVKIEVRRSGVDVVTRPGYYAIPPTQVVPFSPEERNLLTNFSTHLAQSTLPISLELSPFRSPQGLYIVPLSFEIPPRSVTFGPKAGKQRMQLDVVGVVKNGGQERILSRLGASFDVELTAEQYESILNDKIFYRQDMELEPGTYTIDLLVKDRLSGKTAARRENLVLPDPDQEFAVSNAILSRHATAFIPSLKGPADVLSAGNVQIRPSPSRQFRRTENLIIFFRLYNPAVAPEIGKSLVKVTISLMRNGQLVTPAFQYELSESIDESSPQQTFAKYIKLAGLVPGKYTAVIECRDVVRRKTLTQNSSFEITP
jgi:VWFA-related protein